MASSSRQISRLRLTAFAAWLSTKASVRHAWSGFTRPDRGGTENASTIAFVSGYVRQQVRSAAPTPPVAYAMHAHLMSRMLSRSRGQTRSVKRWRAAAGACQAPAPHRWWSLVGVAELSETEQSQLHQQAKELGRGIPAIKAPMSKGARVPVAEDHQRRGLDRPRKRACLTRSTTFSSRVLTADRAERFFGRSPARCLRDSGSRRDTASALSPPRRALGQAQRV